MKLNGDTGSGYFLVDPDGSGGNEPFAGNLKWIQIKNNLTDLLNI